MGTLDTDTTYDDDPCAELFEAFIDSGPVETGNNDASSRTSAEAWSGMFGISDSLGGSDPIGNQPISSGPGRLPDLSGVRCLRRQHAESPKPHFLRPSTCGSSASDQAILQGSSSFNRARPLQGSLPSGSTNTAKLATAHGARRRNGSASTELKNRSKSLPPKMARSSDSRQRVHDNWIERLETSVNNCNISGHYQDAAWSPPSSAPISQSQSQTQWNDTTTSPHQFFDSQFASNRPNSYSGELHPSSKQHFASPIPGHFTPAPSPSAEHQSLEHTNSFYPSPQTPNFSDSFPAHSIPTFAGVDPGRAYSWEQGAQFSQGGITTQPGEMLDFADSSDHPWWFAASGAPQCNPAYPTSRQQNPISHVQYFDESELDSNVSGSGLMIHAEHDAMAARSISESYKDQWADGTLRPTKSLPQRDSALASRSSSPATSSHSQRRSSVGHHRRSKTATGVSRSATAGDVGNVSAAGGAPGPTGSFVNYTPDDSKKILTGVAPSGSAKTKARREKEAADKRRRLSMAAAKAVIDAGGDISALERQGLLV